MKENLLLKKKVKRLEGQRVKVTKRVITEKVQDILKKVFTKKQIYALLNNKSKVKWGLEDICSAIGLRSISPRAYRYLRKHNYPLPGLSTLRNWTARMQLPEGILSNIIFLMTRKAPSLQLHQKLCVLSFDEVYISPKVEIDRSVEQAIGLHKTVQVGMVRGLFDKWKQIIFYGYDRPLTQDIVNNIISELYEAGYLVVAIVTDLGPTNTKVFKNMNIGIKNNQKSFFIHPSDINLKVFVFKDIPHLLKLIRNHFLDYGFVINGKRISKECIIEAVRANENRDLKVVFKINLDHLQVKNADRQNVAMAGQLFSKTTARGVFWCGEQGYLTHDNFVETCEFMELIDSWFDIFNSKLSHGYKYGKEPYGLNLQKQDEILNKVTDVMLTMKIGKHKTLLPFQEGVILSKNSLQQLLPYLQEHFSTESFKISYILTNRLNQDCLENLFSYLRSMGGPNGQPSALNVRHRLKWYILGKNSAGILPEKCNTEQDKDTPLIDFHDKEEKIMSYAFDTSEDSAEFEADEETQHFDVEFPIIDEEGNPVNYAFLSSEDDLQVGVVEETSSLNSQHQSNDRINKDMGDSLVFQIENFQTEENNLNNNAYSADQVVYEEGN